MHDPDRVPEVRGVRRAGRPGVPEPPGGGAHALEPEVGVHRAQRAGPGERRVREGPQRQGQERLIYLVDHAGLPF